MEMGGAYTAKPAVVAPVVVPPGWDPDWPFPGPNPPGYFNVHSLSISVSDTETSDTMKIHDIPSVLVKLLDRVGYATVQPPAVSLLTWSATLGGELAHVAVMDGIPPEYDTTIYSDVGDDFWGTDTRIMVLPFPTEEDIGKELRITVSGEIGGISFEKSASLVVVGDPPPGPVYRVAITIHVSSSVYGPGVWAYGGIRSTWNTQYAGFNYEYPYGGPGAWTIVEYDGSPYIIPSSENSGEVLGCAFVGTTVKLKASSGGGAGDVTTVLGVCNVYEDDVLIATYTKTVSATSAGSGWVNVYADWLLITETGATEL